MRISLLILAVLVSTSHSYVRRRQLHSLGAGTGKVLLEFQQNFTLWEHGAVLRAHNISDMMTFRVQNYSESYNKLRNTLVIKPIMTTFLKALFDDASAFRRTLDKYTRTSQIVRTTKQKFIPLIRNDIKDMQSRIIKSPLALRCLEANKARIGNVFTLFWRRTDPYIGKAFAELDARIRNYDHIIEESVKRREQTVIRGCHLPHATIVWNNSQKICYENYYIKIQRELFAEFKRYQSAAITNLESFYASINSSIEHIIQVSIKDYRTVKAGLDTCMRRVPLPRKH